MRPAFHTYLAVLAALLVPLVPALYVAAQLPVKADEVWTLDLVWIALVFGGLRVVSAPFRRLALVLLAVFAFLYGALSFANIVYFRFFHVPLSVAAFSQIENVGSVSSSIVRLTGVSDLIACFVLPLSLVGLSGGIGYRSARRTSLAFVCAGGVVCSLGLLAGDERANALTYGDPAARLIRQLTVSRNRQIDADLIKRVEADFERYYPIGQPGYVRSQLGRRGKLTLKPRTLKGPQPSEVNVVLIVMESVPASASGLYGAAPSFTPNLDRLGAAGVAHPVFYANGSQTVRGELAILCSFYPLIEQGPVYSRFPDVALRCLPEILRQHGYETLWFSAYDRTYGNKEQFLKRHGIVNLHDRDDLPSNAPSFGWGVSDEALFEYTQQVLDKQQEPFFAEIMTLSNHHPFSFPYPSNRHVPTTHEGTPYGDLMRGVFYTDYALGRFIDSVKHSPWFDRTLFVVTSDHGIWLFPKRRFESAIVEQEAYFRVPLVMFGQGLTSFEAEMGSQVDIAPTVLELLGIRSENTFVGASLLHRRPEHMPILMVHESQWNLRRGNRYCYAVGSSCFTDHIPFCPKGAVSSPIEQHCLDFSGDLLRTALRGELSELQSVHDPLLVRYGSDLARYHQYLTVNNLAFAAD